MWSNAVAAFGFGKDERLRVVGPASSKSAQTLNKANITHVVMAWILQWCHSESANTQQLTQDDKQHAQAISRRELHQDFCKTPTNARLMEGTNTAKKECVSYQTFCRCIARINKDPEQPTIKFHKHKTQQECARCTALKFLIRSAKRRKAASEVRDYELKLLQHRTQARWERLAYQIRVAAGSERKRAWSIGMDGYCSFKSSCFTIKACFNPMHTCRTLLILFKAAFHIITHIGICPRANQ